MATVRVDNFPPGKLKDAYDAGRAYRVDHFGDRGTRREQPKKGADGMMVIDESRNQPAMERKRRARGGYRMVTPSGVVVHSPMSQGSGHGVDEDPARRATVLARLHARGTIRYGDCPVRNPLSLQWLTAKQRKEWKVCDVGSYGEYNACKHIEMLIADRKETHARREAKANERYRTLGERQLEQDKQSNQDVVSLIKAMAQRQTYTGDEKG